MGLLNIGDLIDKKVDEKYFIENGWEKRYRFDPYSPTGSKIIWAKKIIINRTHFTPEILEILYITNKKLLCCRHKAMTTDDILTIEDCIGIWSNI